jgi:hypothetical protein
LGANVVVELNSESRARRPTTRVWAIIRRADRDHRRHLDRRTAAATAATPTAPVGPIAAADLSIPRSGGWLRMLDNQVIPTIR